MKRHPHETTVLALFSSADKAQSAMDALAPLPLSAGDVSLILSEEAYDREELVQLVGSDFLHEESVRAGKIGSIFGAVIAGLTATAGMLTAGAGLLAAGPIVAIIAAAGGVGGGLFSAGFTEEQAKRIDDGLRQGEVLVLVHAENKEIANSAEEIFRQHHADKIHHHH